MAFVLCADPDGVLRGFFEFCDYLIKFLIMRAIIASRGEGGHGLVKVGFGLIIVGPP